jgi:radical SAM-linked protein
MGYTYHFRVRKEQEMIYISHLDLMRLLGRAVRRASLPVALTLGFHPHFKLRMKRALKLGVSSQSEEGQMVLDERIEEKELEWRLQAQLPQGLKVEQFNILESIL